jgi:general secretion pathway protein L
LASLVDPLIRPLRDAANRVALPELLQWWIGELRAMVPARWRERFAARGATIVSVKGDEWRSLRRESGRVVEGTRTNLAGRDVSSRREAFKRLVQDGPSSAGNVWLALAPEEVLVRSVTMPLAAEEAVREAVGFELDRLTPFTAEQVFFDCRMTGRDVPGQRLSLDLAVVPRRLVEQRVAELQELGATVLGVGLPDDLAASATPFNLLPADRRARPAMARSTVVARSLALLTALLALGALLYPLAQKREAVIALQPRVDTAKAGADVADRLAKEIEKLAAEHNYLVAKKQGQYPAVTLIEDLSRLLPDTTWVQQLDIKTGPKIRELQLAGETGSSSQLVEVLEKSGSLANANFKSPLTKGATPNTERFLIAAEVKVRSMPDPIPENALGQAPAGPAMTPASAPATADSPGTQPSSTVSATVPVPPGAPGTRAAASGAAPATAASAPVPAPQPAKPTPAAPAPAPKPAPADPAPSSTSATKAVPASSSLPAAKAAEVLAPAKAVGKS